MSWSLQGAQNVSPKEALAALLADTSIPDGPRTIISEWLDANDEAGAQTVSVTAYGHTATSILTGVVSNCHINVTTVLGPPTE